MELVLQRLVQQVLRPPRLAQQQVLRLPQALLLQQRLRRQQVEDAVAADVEAADEEVDAAARLQPVPPNRQSTSTSAHIPPSLDIPSARSRA